MPVKKNKQVNGKANTVRAIKCSNLILMLQKILLYRNKLKEIESESLIPFWKGLDIYFEGQPKSFQCFPFSAYTGFLKMGVARSVFRAIPK